MFIYKLQKVMRSAIQKHAIKSVCIAGVILLLSACESDLPAPLENREAPLTVGAQFGQQLAANTLIPPIITRQSETADSLVVDVNFPVEGDFANLRLERLDTKDILGELGVSSFENVDSTSVFVKQALDNIQGETIGAHYRLNEEGSYTFTGLQSAIFYRISGRMCLGSITDESCSAWTGYENQALMRVSPPVIDGGIKKHFAAKAYSTYVEFEWQSADNAELYALYKKEGNGEYKLLKDKLDGTTYQDHGVTGSTSYSYKLYACQLITDTEVNCVESAYPELSVETLPVISNQKNNIKVDVDPGSGSVKLGIESLKNHKVDLYQLQVYSNGKYVDLATFNEQETGHVTHRFSHDTDYDRDNPPRYRVRACVGQDKNKDNCLPWKEFDGIKTLDTQLSGVTDVDVNDNGEVVVTLSPATPDNGEVFVIDITDKDGRKVLDDYTTDSTPATIPDISMDYGKAPYKVTVKVCEKGRLDNCQPEVSKDFPMDNLIRELDVSTGEVTSNNNGELGISGGTELPGNAKYQYSIKGDGLPERLVDSSNSPTRITGLDPDYNDYTVKVRICSTIKANLCSEYSDPADHAVKRDLSNFNPVLSENDNDLFNNDAAGGPEITVDSTPSLPEDSVFKVVVTDDGGNPVAGSPFYGKSPVKTGSTPLPNGSYRFTVSVCQDSYRDNCGSSTGRVVTVSDATPRVRYIIEQVKGVYVLMSGPAAEGTKYVIRRTPQGGTAVEQDFTGESIQIRNLETSGNSYTIGIKSCTVSTNECTGYSSPITFDVLEEDPNGGSETPELFVPEIKFVQIRTNYQAALNLLGSDGALTDKGRAGGLVFVYHLTSGNGAISEGSFADDENVINNLPVSGNTYSVKVKTCVIAEPARCSDYSQPARFNMRKPPNELMYDDEPKAIIYFAHSAHAYHPDNPHGQFGFDSILAHAGTTVHMWTFGQRPHREPYLKDAIIQWEQISGPALEMFEFLTGIQSRVFITPPPSKIDQSYEFGVTVELIYADGTSSATSPATIVIQVPGNPGLTWPANGFHIDYRQKKAFVFGWNAVNDATHYKLYEQLDSSSDFAQIARVDHPATTYTYNSVPLFARANARYRVDSCNDAGCVPSEKISVTPQGLTQGVSSIRRQSGQYQAFGFKVALNGDGTILAASNKKAGDNPAYVNIYSKVSGNWAYVQTLSEGDATHFGSGLKVSDDGNTIVVAADSSIIIYTRSGNSWAKTETLTATNNTVDAHGVLNIAINDDATVIAVGGKNVEIFRKANGSTWLSLGWSNAASDWVVDLDGSGDTLVAASQGVCQETSDGSCIYNSGTVDIYTYSADAGISTWSKKHTLSEQQIAAANRYGVGAALSKDGTKVAIVAQREGSSPQMRLYVAETTDGWETSTQTLVGVDDNFVKGPDYWPAPVAFDSTGTYVVLGKPEAQNGLNFTKDTTGHSSSFLQNGAVWVYKYNGSDWDFETILVAPHARGAQQYFGFDIAISGDDRTLAVGAYQDNGTNIGIDSTYNNQGTPRSGAVHLF